MPVARRTFFCQLHVLPSFLQFLIMDWAGRGTGAVASHSEDDLHVVACATPDRPQEDERNPNGVNEE